LIEKNIAKETEREPKNKTNEGVIIFYQESNQQKKKTIVTI
jgi:hypothetical protein